VAATARWEPKNAKIFYSLFCGSLLLHSIITCHINLWFGRHPD
jgi:hypothetical protein